LALFIISDRVKESSVTTGTGNIVLTGPYGGFQTFLDAIGDGNSTYYAIENNVRWEVGVGTYNAGGNYLSRDTVLDSSNGGAKISLTGVSTVFCTLAAGRAVIEVPEGSISGAQFIGTTVFKEDVIASGTTTFDDGLVNFVRPNSKGNFFHAYKDDGTNKTISLHINEQISDPLFKFGFKQNPDSVTEEPNYSYLFGRESTAGVLNDSGNYFQIGVGFGFAVTSNYNNVFIASSDDGVSVTPDNITNPSFVIEKSLGSSQDIQQWLDSDSSVFSAVDSEGKFGILLSNPLYPLHVAGSGKIGSMVFSSGIYFADGSYQDTSATGSALAVSGWSEETIYNVSGYFQDYVDSQDHSASAVSGWADATIIHLSGWADTTITNGDNSVSGWAGATIANTGAAVSGWTRGVTFFTEDLTVSLPNGKTFGRYETGETIPASGKTPREVIEMAIVEPIAPTVSLTSSSSVDFNQTSVSNTLNFSHTINSFGASVATASLEFRRANTGSWTVLNSSTSASSSFVHSFTDTAYNTDVMNYRYVVTDTAGGTATATKDIQPDTYSNPTISLTVTGASISSPETWNSREKGNVSSTISCTINRNESYVDLQTYEIEYSLNGGAYQVVDSGSIGPGNTTITPFAHNPVADNAANNMRYRVKVVDEYLDSIGSQRYSSVRQVNYNYILYFGSESSAATTSNEVRGLSNKRFPSAGDTFDFNTGNTLRFFNVAIPDGETISSVIDLDALNANITSSYINNPFNVQDFGGNNKLYNVYTMEVAVPYSSSHTHRITKG